MKLFLRDLVIVGVVSFLLHFVWEISQCSVFYKMEVSFSNPLMWSATFGDMNMAIFLYALLTFVNGSRQWIITIFTRVNMTVTILYGLFLSFFFEVSALYKGRWEYSELMPLFPFTNIGLVPVLQLLILFVLAFYLSSKLIQKIELQK